MNRGLCSCSHSASLHDASGCCTYSSSLASETWFCPCAQFTAPDAELLAWWAELDDRKDRRSESLRSAQTHSGNAGRLQAFSGLATPRDEVVAQEGSELAADLPQPLTKPSDTRGESDKEVRLSGSQFWLY